MKNKGRRRIILSIDVGGSRVKMMTSAKRMKRHFDSGTDLTAKSMVEQVKQLTKIGRTTSSPSGIRGRSCATVRQPSLTI
jgi:hypothetical protein